MLENSKIRFATLQERLVCKLSSEEAKKSQKGVERPHPFDAFCPSMMSKLDELFCKKCGFSWPSIAALKQHLKPHPKGQKLQVDVPEPLDDLEDEFETEDEDEDENVSTSELDQDNSEKMPVFTIQTYLNSIYPFEQVTDEVE